MLDVNRHKYQFEHCDNLLLLGFGENKRLPNIQNRTPKEQEPVRLGQVAFNHAEKIINGANSLGLTIPEFLALYIPGLDKKGVTPEPSVTAKVGNTNVTTLIDGGQIFNKTIEYLNSAKKNIQIEMFELGNMKIDGEIWPSNGAENVAGWAQQQAILPLLLKKKKEGVNIQVILDSHKWYQDGNGDKFRHHGNMQMIQFLKKKGIDVVPYPRQVQEGTLLQHNKFLAVDGKKVLMGGMNWGNHSPANHDACVAIETVDENKPSEVDNLIMDIFNTDWAFAWRQIGLYRFVPPPLDKSEQNSPLLDLRGIKREIKPENVEVNKIVGELYNNPEDKNRFIPEEIKSKYIGLLKKEFKVEKVDSNYIDVVKKRKRQFNVNRKLNAIYSKFPKMPNGVYVPKTLNLPEVNPVKDPKIQVLTNLPRDYKHVGLPAPTGALGGSETIGDYVKERLDSCDFLRAELFVFSNKELVAKTIQRCRENKEFEKTDGKRGRPFDVQILVDPGILKDFPYCRSIYEILRDEKVPVKKFNVDEKTNQRMHCKWAVFGNKDAKNGDLNNVELLMGSANWSEVGLENNINKGKRDDYPLFTELIHKQVARLQEKIEPHEKRLGLPSLYNKTKGHVFTKLDSDKLKTRGRSIKNELGKHEFKELKHPYNKYIEVKDFAPKGKKHVITRIQLTPDKYQSLQKLLERYEEVRNLLKKQKEFGKGNHECAVAIKNPELAGVFIRQFAKDWEHSPLLPIVRDPYKKPKLSDFIGKKEPNFYRPKLDARV